MRRDYYRGHLQTPKTARSDRQFKLPPLLVNALKRYLSARTSQSDLLFPSAAGTIFDDRNLIRREVELVLRPLGIPRFGWHSLRPTFSTIAENNRVAGVGGAIAARPHQPFDDDAVSARSG